LDPAPSSAWGEIESILNGPAPREEELSRLSARAENEIRRSPGEFRRFFQSAFVDSRDFPLWSAFFCINLAFRSVSDPAAFLLPLLKNPALPPQNAHEVHALVGPGFHLSLAKNHILDLIARGGLASEKPFQSSDLRKALAAIISSEPDLALVRGAILALKRIYPEIQRSDLRALLAGREQNEGFAYEDLL
jgi:hypothetical protein